MKPTLSNPRPAADQARLVFAISVAATVGLWLLPYDLSRLIGYPLYLLSTVAHELGHAVVMGLTGSGVEEVVINPDGSGYAQGLRGVTPVLAAVIAAGGLVGPAGAAAIGFVCARRATPARIFLGVLGLAFALAVVLWIRSLTGLVVVSLYAAAFIALTRLGSATVAQAVLVFLSVQLSLSVFSRSDYLFTDSAGPGKPSDVANMAESLGGPYWFWGLVCGAISVLALALGAFLLLRSGRGRTTKPTA